MSESPAPQNIRKVVRIAAKPGTGAAMRAALLDLQTATRLEPGCLEFRFYQALDEDEVFLLVEDFANQAALQAHMHLPHTTAFFALDIAASIKAIERAWLSD